MDDPSAIMEKLKAYQHQNKNLLSENAKLHAKCKRLKLEKKQLKHQLSTQIVELLLLLLLSSETNQNQIKHK